MNQEPLRLNCMFTQMGGPGCPAVQPRVMKMQSLAFRRSSFRPQGTHCLLLHANGFLSDNQDSTAHFAAVRRVQALEAYRQLFRQNPSEIDLFQAALLIAKHKHPLLVQLHDHADASAWHLAAL